MLPTYENERIKTNHNSHAIRITVDIKAKRDKHGAKFRSHFRKYLQESHIADPGLAIIKVHEGVLVNGRRARVPVAGGAAEADGMGLDSDTDDEA